MKAVQTDKKSDPDVPFQLPGGLVGFRDGILTGFLVGFATVGLRVVGV